MIGSFERLRANLLCTIEKGNSINIAEYLECHMPIVIFE